MTDITKKIIKHNLKIKSNKINIEKENSFQTILKTKRTESLPNFPNNKYKQNNQIINNQSRNSRSIKEIHINLKNIPKSIFNKYKVNKKNKNQNISNINYSNETTNSPKINQLVKNNSDAKINFQKQANSPPAIETYVIKLAKNQQIKKVYTNNNNKRKIERENNSMDITYYKPRINLNLNRNENINNSFWKKFDNNEYFTHNNSFIMNRTNIDDDFKLNNTIDYNQEKYINQKNSFTNINNIPKPQKFKKKITPIPIRRPNESNNNSFCFDDINNKNNDNNIIKNNRYNIKSLNNNIDNRNYNIIHKKSITDYKNKIYSNKTYSPKYIKNIEKIGIQLSFSQKKYNEPIDLISPEILKDLERHSCEKPQKQIIFSDLDINKVKDNNNNNYNIKNNILYQKRENYDKMRKKYIKRISSYLLKNRKNKFKKRKNSKENKYDIIDIKEKIKKEKRNRTLSNENKFRKKEIIKDNPSATKIKKEDDKGGKIDFKIPTKNVRNKSYIHNNRKYFKKKYIFNNLNINKNFIILKAAKTIQKWWRSILTQFFTELNVIKIQSAFRSFLYRKNKSKVQYQKSIDKYKNKENIIKIIYIQRKWREYYISIKKKRTNNSFSFIKNNEKFIYKKTYKGKYQYNKNTYENNNSFRTKRNNNVIQQNNNFGIISNTSRNSFNNNENFLDNEFKNEISNDDNNNNRNKDFPPLMQFKNDIFEIKGQDESHIYEDDDIYKYLRSDYNTERSNKNIYNNNNPKLINGKNNLRLCLFTKKYYKNNEENKIIYIQKYYRNYLRLKNKNNNYNIFNDINNIKEEKIKFPILFPCFIDKIRMIKNNTKLNDSNEDILLKNNNILFIPKYKKNEDKKYDKSKNKISIEGKISINSNESNYETSSFLFYKKYCKKQNNESRKSNVITNINHIHDIEFSINNEKNIEIKKIPIIYKCYYSKKNLFLIKKKPIEYSIIKINSEKYDPKPKKKEIFEISPICANEFPGNQKNKTEYKISPNIKCNYTTSTFNLNKNHNDRYYKNNNYNFNKVKIDDINNDDINNNNNIINNKNSNLNDDNNNDNNINKINNKIVDKINDDYIESKMNDKYNNLKIYKNNKTNEENNINNSINSNNDDNNKDNSNMNDNNNYKDKNNLLIDNFSNEIKAKNKNEPLYEICSINTNILSNKENKTSKNIIFEIDNQNNLLNYKGNKKEIILKIPIQLKNYFTKKIILIDDYYKIKETNLNKLKLKQLKNNNINNDSDEENSEKKDNDNIYKYPLINNGCYISKIFKEDRTKDIILIQKFYKNLLNKKKVNSENIYIRQVILNSLITKQLKDNSLDKNKIKLIQKYFRKYMENKKLSIDKNIIKRKNLEISNENENEKEKEDNYNNDILDENKFFYNNKKNNYSRNNNINSSTFEKNTHTYENITTSYDTSDNYKKKKTSFKVVEKTENLVQSKTVINTQENRNIYQSSYKITKNINERKNNNEYKYEKIETKKYEENKSFNEIKNNIQTAYQIKIYKDEEKEQIFKNKIKKYYIKYVIYKLKEKVNMSKMRNMLKMLIQRINKNINQYVFQKIQIYNNINKQRISFDFINNKNNNIDNNIENNNILLSNISDLEPKKKNFFFNTIKRHLKINKLDNNWKENNEVINLLKDNIPEYFINYPYKTYIPYINRKQEKNLINNSLFLFDDDKLADYMYKCYKIERNILTITPYIIKNRLIKNPLKNQNIFTITRYMDNLYKDIINGNICQNCCCKNNELCLIGCQCHNNSNFLINKNLNIKKTKTDMNSYININNINDNQKDNINKSSLKFEVLKRFSEISEKTDPDILLDKRNDLYYNNKTNITENYIINNNNKRNNIIDDNFDKNSFNSEYINKNNSKINNYIKNFSLRKQTRNSISSIQSNLSYQSNKVENKKIIKYNYNNNLKEKNFSKINIDKDDQSNICEDDIKNENEEDFGEIKKIHKSLSKKRMNPIIPISNNSRNKISNINLFRNKLFEKRNKSKETIKLRDINMNYDNEIYNNV